MVTKRINSGASGSGTGDDWTNAYTSLATAYSSVTEASGDIFLVHYTHTENVAATLGAALTAVGANRGVKIISVDKDDSDKYRAGAAIVPQANSIKLHGLVQGLSIDNSGSNNNLTIEDGQAVFQSCAISKQHGTSRYFRLNQNATLAAAYDFVDCSFACGTSYVEIFRMGGPQRTRFIRPTFSGSKGANVPLFYAPAADLQAILVDGADLTSVIDYVVDSTTATGIGAYDITLLNCKMPASWSVEKQGTYIHRQGCTVRLIGCATGTVSAPVYADEWHFHEGYSKAQASKYRTANYSSSNPYAYELTAAASRTWKQSHKAAKTQEISVWVDGGSAITATVAIAHNAVGAGAAGVLNDDECWVEWTGPSNAGSATAQNYTASSMRALNGTAAALTTDADSTWTGTSIGTKQKVSLTYTPTIGGLLTARVFLAPESGSDKTIYVCPKIDVA